MAQLQQAAALFEVNIPEYKQLRSCRREIALLKTLWDTIGNSNYEIYILCPWKAIENPTPDVPFQSIYMHVHLGRKFDEISACRYCAK